ncbi:hypothetical protein PC129_g22414 [Phytophthora cactorum]|uniref:Retrotransposon gag domain-containing protein n=2 Tax=Phytophthora cactorum TaxID=29920 RepID=A0A8T1H305_9STRA|nr:hypothetical protein PC129_g22414 [Phytophthora cactorum]
MVFGEEYSDDEGERNVGRGKVRGDHDEEHPVSVPKAVARLERATGGQLMEKARDFWMMFEANTEGLPDQSRLLVFRQKLKGREAERWWGDSSIRTFPTLKVRFHNQFLSRTADELWEHLEMRSVSGGFGPVRIARLSQPANALPTVPSWFEEQAHVGYSGRKPGVRYHRGVRVVNFKDMHRPMEEGDEFSDAAPSKKKKKDAPVLASVDALAQQMQVFMHQQMQTSGGLRVHRENAFL